MLRFRILDAAADRRGREGRRCLLDGRKQARIRRSLTPLLRCRLFLPLHLFSSLLLLHAALAFVRGLLPSFLIGLSLSESPANGLAFEACGGRRRGRFLSNGVKGEEGRRGERGGRKSSRCRGCEHAAASSPRLPSRRRLSE